VNIATILEEQARVRPLAIALIDRLDRQSSFQDLWRTSGICAEMLQQCGVGRGDGVLLLHPISTDLYVFLIALFRIGSVGLILDPSVGLDHVERCCQTLPPKAFFGSRKAHLLGFASSALRRIPLQFSSGWVPGASNICSFRGTRKFDATAELRDSDPAIVTFTSGSTGPPKAAVRSHGFLIAQYRALQQSLHLSPGRVDLTTLPIFVLANLAAGVTSVLPDADMRRPGEVEPKRILRQIRQHAVESMAASPAFVGRIVDHLRLTGEVLPSVREIFVGGAPVFPKLLQRCAESLPTANVVAVYGST
jgi:olefin beta-lactone synthetase